MRELDLNARARRIEEVMKPRLAAMAEKFDIIGEVRGRGAMIAIELVKTGHQGARTRRPPPRSPRPATRRACWS